jgi:glycosyltransferase involved in cell wall biosynthesis
MLDITPLVITFNEAPNIERNLEHLTWAQRIVVVDSFSTDETKTICSKFSKVHFVEHKFESFADQCNFGLELVGSPWVLSLDADYILTEELVAELQGLGVAPAFDAYTARFKYCVSARPLRSTLYPPRTVLYRTTKARYRNEGHGHRVQIAGTVGSLNGFILHDDRKPLDRWFGEQLKYSSKEAEYLLTTPREDLNRADRLRRRVLIAPVAVFIYTLVWRRLVLDGWPGWYYVLQRTLAETLLSLKLIENKLKRPRQS